MKLSDNHMSGRDVQRFLGINEPRLRTLVKNKTLSKVIPPGRQTAVYLRSEVEAFAERWEAFLLLKEPPKTTFSVANVDDMPSEYELAKRILGATISVEQRQAWLRKNPESDFIVKHGSKVVAYLQLLPVKHKTIEDFMDGKIRGWQVPEDDVETFESGKEVECILMGTASDPDMGEIVREGYMLVLIRGLMGKLREWGQRGIKLTKIYATSETPTGISMALHLGMEEVKPRLGKRLRFVLDVNDTDSFLFNSYKEGLSKWANEQKIETPPNHKKRVPSNEKKQASSV